jgi:hypothetical protein
MTSTLLIYRQRALLALFFFFCFFLAACGGGGDDDDRDAGVTDLSADPDSFTVGSGSIVSLGFSFSANEIFDDDRNVEIAVQLPPTVRYRSGTADLKRPIDDRQLNPQEIACSDSSSLLIFDLSSSELAEAENPSGDADAEIHFTIDGLTAGNDQQIAAAAAEDNIQVSCGSVFPAQATTLIAVQ